MTAENHSASQSRLLRICADFNNIDREGRIELRHADDLKDDLHVPLREGMRVILWDDIEVEGILEREEGIWRARVNWETAIDRETGMPLPVRGKDAK